MNSKIIFVLIAVLAVTGLFFWGYAQNTNPTNVDRSTDLTLTGALTAETTFHDFGAISMKDGNVTKDFLINNPTDREVTLNNIYTSCMCTTALLVAENGEIRGPFGMPGHGGFSSPLKEVIPTGESRIIRVVYDPNAHGPAGVGPTSRTISLIDTDGGAVQLEIKALVTP